MLRELVELLRLRNFRKLFAVRLVSQAGDGMFQVGLASLLFFSPERATSAAAVATGFAVMLAPFTIVGPFAGVFLDRWSRRQVLVVGNIVRTGLTVVLATVMLVWGSSGPTAVWIYVLALAALSVNRFLLAGLSAGLPRVVDGPLLLTANSLTPTLGAASAVVGGGLGFVLGRLFAEGRARDTAALVVAAMIFTTASILATRMSRTLLGPEHPAEGSVRNEIARVARGLVDGARYLSRRRTPGQALVVMAVHRFLYGVVFIAAILISRNLLSSPTDADAGLTTFATVFGLTVVGGFGAVILTPTLSRYTGSQAWIVLMLVLATGSQLLLATTPTRVVIYVGAGLLGLAAQATKISVDTIVQRDTTDAYRGRAFAFYDVLYNAAFVGAAALAAFALPDDGWSRGVFLGLAATYAVAAVLFGTRAARVPAEVGELADVPAH